MKIRSPRAALLAAVAAIAIGAFAPAASQAQQFRYGSANDILGLDPFTRDQKIFDELRRLKALDRVSAR